MCSLCFVPAAVFLLPCGTQQPQIGEKSWIQLGGGGHQLPHDVQEVGPSVCPVPLSHAAELCPFAGHAKPRAVQRCRPWRSWAALLAGAPRAQPCATAARADARAKQTTAVGRPAVLRRDGARRASCDARAAGAAGSTAGGGCCVGARPSQRAQSPSQACSSSSNGVTGNRSPLALALTRRCAILAPTGRHCRTRAAGTPGEALLARSRGKRTAGSRVLGENKPSARAAPSAPWGGCAPRPLHGCSRACPPRSVGRAGQAGRIRGTAAAYAERGPLMRAFAPRPPPRRMAWPSARCCSRPTRRCLHPHQWPHRCQQRMQAGVTPPPRLHLRRMAGRRCRRARRTAP